MTYTDKRTSHVRLLSSTCPESDHPANTKSIPLQTDYETDITKVVGITFLRSAILKSHFIHNLDYNFDFADWIQLLKLSNLVLCHLEVYRALRRTTRDQTMGVRTRPNSLATDLRSSAVILHSEFKCLERRIKRHPDILVELLSRCEEQIMVARSARVLHGSCREALLPIKSTLVPGQHVIFRHDPKEFTNLFSSKLYPTWSWDDDGFNDMGSQEKVSLKRTVLKRNEGGMC